MVSPAWTGWDSVRNVRAVRPWRKEATAVRGVIEDGTRWTLVQGTER